MNHYVGHTTFIYICCGARGHYISVHWGFKYENKRVHYNVEGVVYVDICEKREFMVGLLYVI